MAAAGRASTEVPRRSTGEMSRKRREAAKACRASSEHGPCLTLQAQTQHSPEDAAFSADSLELTPNSPTF